MSAKQFVRDKQYQDAIQTLTEAKKIYYCPLKVHTSL